MISVSNRSKAVELIDDAVKNGARLFKACEKLGITERTYYRLVKQNNEVGTIEDLHPIVARPEPTNKLSKDEREKIITVVNQPEYTSMPPCEIVPALADKGMYLASESSFYRVLRQYGMQNQSAGTDEILVIELYPVKCI